MRIWDHIKKFGKVFVESVEGLFADGGFNMAAALAYYTVFSLAPILLIIVAAAGFIMDDQVVRQNLFSELEGLVGEQSAEQYEQAIDNLVSFGAETDSEQDKGRWWGTIISIVTLFIGSTTVFNSMQLSLNRIWRVKPHPQGGITQGLLKLIKDRFMSFGIILGLAFILLVALMVNAIVAALGQYLSEILPFLQTAFVESTAFLLPNLIVAVVFAVIFKVLPDARPRWRDVIVGAIFTALLFALGKFLIGLYIGNSSFSNTYGAAGSILIVLTWVFYSAVIFYLGAEFTFHYAKVYGPGIRPEPYAVKWVTTEVELDGDDDLTADPQPDKLAKAVRRDAQRQLDKLNISPAE